MNQDDIVFIRAYALGLMASGETPEEALKRAKESLAKKRSDELILENLLQQEGM